jgi:nucleoside-diphosphate-sugar epimerase
MILVTGATGSIGTPFVGSLLERGEIVRILTNKADTKMPGVEIVNGNILDPNAVRDAVRGVDLVYHLAAVVGRHRKGRNVYRINVLGTKNIADRSDAPIVYLSSTDVYGTDSSHVPISEATRSNPDTVYARTKEIAENIILGRGGTVLRSPAVYGENIDPGICPFLDLMERGKMNIIGDGNNRVHWIHINDVIQALLLAGRSRKKGVYLVAGKEVYTQRALVGLLARHLHVMAPRHRTSIAVANMSADYRAMHARITGKKPNIMRTHLSLISEDKEYDTSKARRELGFDPQVGYELGMRGLVDRYLVDWKQRQ